MQRKSFIKGAATLGIAGLLVKIIGVLYRIPLGRLIGDNGLGLYQTAYPFYTILLMLSTAGLPPAISKLVSEHIARGDRAGADKIFKAALVLLITFGLIGAVILYNFSDKLAALAGDPLARLAIAYIAPALFFVAVMSAIRGYFHGLQNMFPTAMTQLVEQLGKVVMGLTFAYYLLPKGIEYGAAGAILGVMASEALAMIVIIIYYFKKREIAPKRAVANQNLNTILKNIVKLSIPILIGASIMPIVALSDSLIIRTRLMDMGYSLDSARELFGLFSGRVNPLINIPGIISLAFCVSIVPAISAAQSKGAHDQVKRNAKIGFKMAMLVGIPSAVGLAILATPIMNLLYNTFALDKNLLAGQLLMILAGGVIFLSILQTLNGVLQGLGRVMIPVIALSIGAAVKIILSYYLIAIPSINIYGAPISTFACYFVAAIIDIIMVKKYTGVKFGFIECIFRPAVASIFMGAAAWGVYALLYNHLNNGIVTLLAVFIGIIVFVICIQIFNVLSRSEIMGLPGGTKMVKIYDKFNRVG